MENPSQKTSSRRRLWDGRRLQGLCVYCGRNRPKTDSQGCDDCCKKKYQYTKKCSTPAKQRAYRQRVRQEVLQKYGGKCECCGESQTEYLTIDHINGDGGLERRQKSGTKAGNAYAFYLELKAVPRRDDLRVLCYNCNNSFAHYGYSPACCKRKNVAEEKGNPSSLP